MKECHALWNYQYVESKGLKVRSGDRGEREDVKEWINKMWSQSRSGYSFEHGYMTAKQKALRVYIIFLAVFCVAQKEDPLLICMYAISVPLERGERNTIQMFIV